MGADLYITRIHEPLVTQYEPLIRAALEKQKLLPRTSAECEKARRQILEYSERMNARGYFRDSYNTTNVLWTLGLSWWKDVIPLLNARHELAGKNLNKFRDRVASAEQQLPANRTRRRYFIGKRKQLLAFLDQAIALKSPIRCSL